MLCVFVYIYIVNLLALYYIYTYKLQFREVCLLPVVHFAS